MVPIATDAGTAYIDVEERLDKLGSKLDRQGPGIFSGWGKKMGLAAGVAIAAGVGAAVAGVKLGSEFLGLGTQLDILRKKAATVFEGDNAGVQKWAKENAAAFGITDDKLSGLAASFGDLLKPMGFTSKEAADMSTKVVGLSGALSAWSGGQRSAADVSQILAKAMLGERDGLKELGIAISEEDVKARLAAKGQKELTGAALEQAKALATQELIFEKSADAQKAWADGSMDAVKKQNALKEKIAELKEDIADKLRPAFAAGAAMLADKFIPALERTGKVVGPILKEVTGGFRAFFMAFKAGDGDVTSSGFAGSMERIANVVRRVVDEIRERWPQVRAVIADVIDAVLAKVGELVDWFKTVWPQIQEAVGHVVAAVQAIWRTFGDELISIAKIAWNQVRNIVETVINIVRGIIETVLAVINGDWGKAWDGIKGILSTAWEFIRETVVNALALVREVLEAGLDVIRGAWERGWNGIKDFLAGVWDRIFDIARNGIARIVDVFLGMVGTIIHAADSAFGWIPGLGDKLHDARVAFDNFRDDANAALRGIDKDPIVISVDTAQARASIAQLRSELDTLNSNIASSGPGGGNRAAANQVEADIAEQEASGDASVQLPDRAHGMDEGPLPGPLGAPLLVRAHGGEWVLTPEQMDDLTSGRSGGSAVDGSGAGADEMAAAFVRALAANPPRAYVVASDAARGLHAIRPR